MSLLNVLNEAGDVVGQASRQEIHAKGLLHADVHVWFFTTRGGLIFQHRAKRKDFFPDYLDVTVGGHVEIGDTFESTAIKETFEETGIHLSPNDLSLLTSGIFKLADPVTQNIGFHLRKVYAYRFAGSLRDLKADPNDILGFEEWPIEKLLTLSAKDKTRFIPHNFDERGLEIVKMIQKLL